MIIFFEKWRCQKEKYNLCIFVSTFQSKRVHEISVETYYDNTSDCTRFEKTSFLDKSVRGRVNILIWLANIFSHLHMINKLWTLKKHASTPGPMLHFYGPINKNLVYQCMWTCHHWKIMMPGLYLFTIKKKRWFDELGSWNIWTFVWLNH